MSSTNEHSNAENRILAAISHGSIVAQGVGVLVGVVIYLNQREKSRFVANQSLQATVYQLINLVITVLLWFLWGIFYGLSTISLIRYANLNPDAPPPAIFWISLVSMVIPLSFMILVILYGLWGALRCWQGKDFRYLILGVWLKKSGLWQK